VPGSKICTAKAISTSNREVYPADLSVTYADRADGQPGRGKKEQKITPQASFYVRIGSPHPHSWRRRWSQQRTTFGLSIPLVALRVSTTNFASPTIFLKL
jgi:hypothetical protein